MVRHGRPRLHGGPETSLLGGGRSSGSPSPHVALLRPSLTLFSIVMVTGSPSHCPLCLGLSLRAPPRPFL